MQAKFSQSLNDLWQKTARKTVGIVFCLCVLIGFGDSLLPILGHLLHILIEVVESLLEHFLESVFHLSARESQLLLFWVGLVIAGYASWRLFCKAYEKSRCSYRYLQNKWRESIEKQSAVRFKAMLLVGMFGMFMAFIS
ncbi:MAG: hypothetical protein ABL903_00580 [Methylococcales bacterium]